jgi:hypothetical protein
MGALLYPVKTRGAGLYPLLQTKMPNMDALWGKLHPRYHTCVVRGPKPGRSFVCLVIANKVDLHFADRRPASENYVDTLIQTRILIQ